MSTAKNIEKRQPIGDKISIKTLPFMEQSITSATSHDIIEDEYVNNTNIPSLHPQTMIHTNSSLITPSPIIFSNSGPSSSKTIRKSSINPIYLPQMRVLFVSIIQLYRSLTDIPSFILDNALFAFAIRKSWLFPQSEHEKIAAKHTYIDHFASEWSSDFIQMIRKKDQLRFFILYILYIHSVTYKNETEWDKYYGSNRAMLSRANFNGRRLVINYVKLRIYP